MQNKKAKLILSTGVELLKCIWEQPWEQPELCFGAGPEQLRSTFIAGKGHFILDLG